MIISIMTSTPTLWIRQIIIMMREKFIQMMMKQKIIHIRMTFLNTRMTLEMIMIILTPQYMDVQVFFICQILVPTSREGKGINKEQKLVSDLVTFFFSWLPLTLFWSGGYQIDTCLPFSLNLRHSFALNRTKHGLIPAVNLPRNVTRKIKNFSLLNFSKEGFN